MKRIALFYKKLIEPGGAERLLIEEYKQFTRIGYKVDIVSFRIHPDALFGAEIRPGDKVELGGSWAASMLKLVAYMRRHPDALFLCASGHIDVYMASVIAGKEYSLHIHHPSYMSFNETDKYSIFQRRHFEPMLNSNFGASRFKKIKDGLTFRRKLFINVRAFMSIRSIRKSRTNFVLSEYCRKEKRILFGIESKVLCGALDEKVFAYKPRKDFREFEGYKHKLLTIARLDENKRIDELLRAHKLLLQQEPDSILLIGGRGPEMQKLTAFAEELGIEDKVRFLGFVPDDDLFDWYAMADAFVSIDWADYRITMYESLVMGTPVILSDESEYDPTLIESSWLTVTHPEPKATSEAMLKALRTPPKTSREELNGLLTNFTWNRYCRNIAEALDRP